MKKILVLALLMFGCLRVSSAETKHEARIVGYQTGEFAVKEPIERQLEEKVIALIPSSRAMGDQIEFSIVGYADQTGISALNDQVGRSRAEEVKAFLSEKFPDAKLVAMTKGDELDVRAVVVSWKFASARAPARNASAPMIWRSREIAFAGLAALACIALWSWLLWLVKKKKISGEAKVMGPAMRRTLVEIKGETYAVPLFLKGDNKWHTPFMTQADPNKPLYRTEYKDAVNAVKSCVKNQTHYGLAIQKLIADGTIRRGHE